MKRKLRFDRIMIIVLLTITMFGMINGFIDARNNPDEFVNLVMHETDRW